MKNVLNERPTLDLHGRLEFSIGFVGAESLAGRDWLDIGCGFGWFENFAREHDVRSITGVEVADEDLAAAREIAGGPVSFTAASVLELPFADASFDGVVMWEVLEHIPPGTEPRAFAEIARVLRPGGSLYLSTPHSTKVTLATDPAHWLIGHRHYRREQVRAYAEEAGLDVARLELRGGWWEIVHMNDLYFSKWVLRRRPLFEEFLRRRIDAEWKGNARPFVHVFLEATK